LQSEVVQFIGALILMGGILIGSYWFVYAPAWNERREDGEGKRLRS